MRDDAPIRIASRPLIEEAWPVPADRALVPAGTTGRPRIAAAPTLEDYAALAAELGFEPENLEDLQLRHFLAASGIRVFDYEAVCQHMDELVEPVRALWFWSPLRLKDGECRHMDGYLSEVPTRGSVRQGHTSLGRPYTQMVPLHILERVRFIELGFKGRAYFFVSDYAVPRPDPYLMVRVSNGAPLVIGRWDAPSWRAPELGEVRRLSGTVANRPKTWSLRRSVLVAGLVIAALFLALKHGEHTYQPIPVARAR